MRLTPKVLKIKSKTYSKNIPESDKKIRPLNNSKPCLFRISKISPDIILTTPSSFIATGSFGILSSTYTGMFSFPGFKNHKLEYRNNKNRNYREYNNLHHPPKSSNLIFSSSTPKLSNVSKTDLSIIGGPHK